MSSLLWLISRSTGLVAEGALVATILCGIGIPGLDRRRAFALHETWTLAAIVSTAIHALTIAADPASPVPPIAAVVPLASPMLRGPVAFGTAALWGLAVVAVSSVWRRYVPVGTWRALHAVAYGTYILALAHALLAGTDTAHPLALAAHALGLAAVVAATVWRVVAPAAAGSARAGAS